MLKEVGTFCYNKSAKQIWVGVKIILCQKGESCTASLSKCFDTRDNKATQNDHLYLTLSILALDHLGDCMQKLRFNIFKVCHFQWDDEDLYPYEMIIWCSCPEVGCNHQYWPVLDRWISWENWLHNTMHFSSDKTGCPLPWVSGLSRYHRSSL